MARTFPVLRGPFGFDPALSILETLGVDDPAATVPADGLGLAEAIVSAAPSDAEFEAGNPAVNPFESSEFGEAAANAPDPMAGIVTFEFDSVPAADGSSSALQPSADSSSPDIKAAVDFGPGGSDAAPASAGESAAVDAAAAAKGGPPGGGGGGNGGSNGVLAEYRSGSPEEAGYDIWIKFQGSGWTSELQQAFKAAADYLTTVITADIGGGGRIGKVVVDDLYVTAEVKAIDGEGGILGQAGPTNVWMASELTAAGKMQFDVADALAYFGQGDWDDIVTHELMHVLGFGSLWNYGANPLVSNYQYTGQQALNAYKETHPAATFIPVENDGGSGTAGAHWDEQALTNELMTGYINTDENPGTAGDNYLSKFSVMSLADLGYAVTNYHDFLV